MKEYSTSRTVMVNYLSVLLLFIAAGTSTLSAQAKIAKYTETVRDSFPVSLFNTYRLSKPLLSDNVFITIKDKPVPDSCFIIHKDSSVISILPNWPHSIFDTVVIIYSSLPAAFKSVYQLNKLSVLTLESNGNKNLFKAQKEESTGISSIFGNKIEKSGTLVRGFTIGSNKDLTLQSGMRLQLNGKLTDDIEINAALTDENSPIQPEGNTERLDELDKVYIEVKSSDFKAIFGDYELQNNSGEFGRINRKLQGVSLSGLYGSTGASLSFASAKGKFNSLQLSGIEGVQGPYQLSGGNGERDIIVIAGTERVFLNGEQLKRGERNDYTIDYGNGQVYFSSNRLIASSSRIVIEYEYSDRKFTRNYFGVSASGKYLNERLNISGSFYREGDDSDAPIDLTLSPEDKSLIASAGNNPLKAARTGISIVAPDSTGKRRGFYLKRTTQNKDSVIDYYFYDPGNDSAIYSIVFSYVGEGKGDYVRERIGVFRFVGSGAGNYLPVQLLPLPELHTLSVVNVSYGVNDYLLFSGEAAFSNYKRNRLSAITLQEENGLAGLFGFELKPFKFRFLGTDGYTLSSVNRFKFTSRYFKSFERNTTIEFNRDYNTAGVSGEDMKLLESSVRLTAPGNSALTLGYGNLYNGPQQSSEKFSGVIEMNNSPVKAEARIENVGTKTNSLSTNWLRSRGKIELETGKINPTAYYETEDKKDRISGRDSLLSSSLRFIEAGAGVNWQVITGVKFNYSYLYRNDFLPSGMSFIADAQSYGHKLDMNYNTGRSFSGNFVLSARKKNTGTVNQSLGDRRINAFAVRWNGRFSQLEDRINGDFIYEVNTQRSAKLERVFVQTRVGTGNYKYSGDKNNNGVKDDSEFEPALYDGDYIQLTLPTETLYPVIDLKTNLRIRIENYSLPFAGNFFSFLEDVSSETNLRTDENTREENAANVYLLKLNTFRDSTKTIQGTGSVQHDIFLFEKSSELSFRFRTIHRNTYSQFSGSNERGKYTLLSYFGRMRLIKEISAEVEYLSTQDYLDAPLSYSRGRNIEGATVYADVVYRPYNSVEFGIKISSVTNTDSYKSKNLTADITGFTLRTIYSMTAKGQVRAEFESSTVSLSRKEDLFPFELTNGNLPGSNYFWRVNFDYRISLNLQATVAYDGRKQAESRVIHTGRAEMRAFF